MQLISVSRFVVCILMFAPGCTAIQLQRSYNTQAKTLSLLYEQQVLDNLAMFSTNASATPFFAVPSDGINQVTDSAGAGLSDEAFTGRFLAHLSGSAGRTKNQSWGLKPVTDPDRLRLMQCAYQRALGTPQSQCPECCELEKDWEGPKYDCNNPCAISSGWVCCSDQWKDVPKCCCDHFGKHCGVYVWVDPCHRSEFSKLVLKIVEYAAGTPYSGPVKEVRYYINADGTPGTIGQHSKVVIANVDAALSMSAIEKKLSIYEKQVQVQRLRELESAINNSVGNSESMKSLLNNSQAQQLVPGLPQLSPNETIERIQSDIWRIEREIQQEQTPMLRTPRDFGPPAQQSGFGVPYLQLQQGLNRTQIRGN
jgi:hypothetical protein